MAGLEKNAFVCGNDNTTLPSIVYKDYTNQTYLSKIHLKHLKIGVRVTYGGYLAKENPIFVLQVRAIQHLEEKGRQGIPTKIRISPYYRLNKQSSLRAIFVHLVKSAV